MNFTIRPSTAYLSLLTAVHLFSIASVCYANLPLTAQAALSMLLLLNLAHLAWRETLCLPLRSFALYGRRLRVFRADGSSLEGELSENTWVTPLCVVLCVTLGGSTLRRVIFYDAMQTDDFRALRVRLRLS